MSFIGINEIHETIDDPKIRARMNIDKPGYNNNICPTLVETKEGKKIPLNYELAELKSSLLVQNIINNEKTNIEMAIFINNIMSKILGSNFFTTIKNYSKKLANSQQKDIFDNYPVAQMKKFANNPEAISNDFLAMYSFLKYIWFMVDGEDSENFLRDNCSNELLVTATIISLVQQEIFMTTEASKGSRFNLPLDNQYRSDQVGISNIYSKYLTRQIPITNPTENEKWYHPGRTQCRMPYMGKYGENMKKYRENNDFNASLQCGISGSVNFFLFMYLASLVVSNKQSENPIKDARNLIIATTTVLVSDGGHNVREIISGLILSIITLKIWLTDIQNELNKQYDKEINLITVTDAFQLYYPTGEVCKYIFDLAQEFYDFLPNNCKKSTENLFKHIVYSFGIWETFINAMYEITKHINPLGVYTSDLNSYDPNILQNPQEAYEIAKNKMYKVWFNFEDVYTDETYVNMMILIGLDANRHTLNYEESFKNATSKFFRSAVENLEDGYKILEVTDKQLNEIIENCNEHEEIFGSELYSKITRKSETIPFAFSSNKKKYKSNIFSNKKVIFLDICNNCTKQEFVKHHSGNLKCKNCGVVGDTKPISEHKMNLLAKEMLSSGFRL